MRTESWVVLSVVLLAGAGASACSSSGPADNKGGSGGSGGEAGACEGVTCGNAGTENGGAAPVAPDAPGGEAGAAGSTAAPACVPTGKGDAPDDNFTDSNCDGIDGDKSKAVFVSPDGDDGGDGSFDAPVATVGKGVALAMEQGKAVYVCTADYAESVVVDAKPVSLFGGYDCADWSRGNARAKIAPAAGSALTLTNVTGVSVDRMAFVSADAATAGESSVAVIVAASTDVHFSHVQVDAGAGAPGVPGTAVDAVASVAKRGASGQDSVSCNAYLDGCKQAARKGGALSLSSCGQTTVRGGFGGKGATKLTDPPAPGAGFAGLPAGLTSGASGSSGHQGASGAPGPGGFGTLNASGYSPSNSGIDGAIGNVGESGGGGDGGLACNYYDTNAVECLGQLSFGNGSTWWGAGGGQGGYGGCGGLGGHGGGGGGASIAVLSINSKLSLSWASLSTAAGGDGGAPSDGAVGQPGGLGGKGGKPAADNYASFKGVTGGQDGGDGGNGGQGGPGGPGAGGPSMTLVALGTAPVTQAITLTPGAGGKGAPGFDGKDAPAGESTDVKVIDAANAVGGK